MATTLCNFPSPGHLLAFIPSNNDVLIIYDDNPVHKCLGSLVEDDTLEATEPHFSTRFTTQDG